MQTLYLYFLSSVLTVQREITFLWIYADDYTNCGSKVEIMCSNGKLNLKLVRIHLF